MQWYLQIKLSLNFAGGHKAQMNEDAWYPMAELLFQFSFMF